jgi:predicted nucleic acid-binding protein
VIVVLDASTLINLVNGGVLAVILGLPGLEFRVSNAVREESTSIAIAVDHAIATGQLGLIDDTMISVQTFALARTELHLGAGETECILAAAILGCQMACDDRAARRRATDRLGQGRVTGVVGLLRRACRVGVLSPDGALAAHRQMVELGGYLPVLTMADLVSVQD